MVFSIFIVVQPSPQSILKHFIIATPHTTNSHSILPALHPKINGSFSCLTVILLFWISHITESYNMYSRCLVSFTCITLFKVHLCCDIYHYFILFISWEYIVWK